MGIAYLKKCREALRGVLRGSLWSIDYSIVQHPLNKEAVTNSFNSGAVTPKRGRKPAQLVVLNTRIQS
jgi:hypothetical protein